MNLGSNIVKKRSFKKVILISLDTGLIIASYHLASIIRYSFMEYGVIDIFTPFNQLTTQLIFSTLLLIGCQLLMRQYKSIWTLAGIEDFMLGVSSFAIGGMINLFISLFLSYRIPLLVTLLASIFSMLLCNGARLGWRLLRRYIIAINTHRTEHIDLKRILIYGAGMGGSLIANEYRNYPYRGKKIIGFLDDDLEKSGTYIGQIPVLGTSEMLGTIIQEYRIDELIIAISHLDKRTLEDVTLIAKKLGVVVKMMPGLFEMIDNKFDVGMIREVKIEELLARDSIQLDHEGISDYLEGQVVMVTGGGGSIGSELCRQIAEFNPKQLIIIDIYENNAYELQNELLRKYPNMNLEVLIASVRDRSRLVRIYQTYRPDVVFHAAAHKHVPLMEGSPSEAIKNNVVGTLNTAELASEFGVKRFVLISTDKAVNPTNVMGATKRMCEMIIQSLNPTSQTEFVAVRFGNVLGSNGSVVPLFKKQITKGGPVTLTHKDITRYFMTIPEAAQLVLQAGGFAQGGEIFVLDMGKPVKIYDLAKNLIKLSGYEPNIDIAIEVTGLRPGEKLYEELLMDEEGLTKTRHHKIFIGQPGEFDLTTIKEQVEELLHVATTQSSQQLKDKLKQVVPTYKEPAHHMNTTTKPTVEIEVVNQQQTKTHRKGGDYHVATN